MQPQGFSKKPKYKIDNYAIQGSWQPITKKYSQSICEIACICQQNFPQNRLQSCYRCKTYVHICLQPQKLRGQHYQCCCCLARYSDPLYSVRQVILQTFYKTESIFKYSNVVDFQFELTCQDLKFPLQIRGFQRNNLDLKWPMQGSFYLNQESQPFFQLKPLLVNSNRKNRKEEYIQIPKKFLKEGKNILSFRIPRINPLSFTHMYQYEERGVYFIGLYSILQFTCAQLIFKVLKDNRLQKKGSIQILKRLSSNEEVQMEKTKIRLMCPYTKDRIKIPVRGKYCQHFICICLQTLILCHIKSRGWKCPVCGKRMNEPEVDVWILEILNDNQNGVDVLISPNGSYEWSQSNEQILSLDSDKQQPIKVNQPIVNQKSIDNVLYDKKQIKKLGKPYIQPVNKSKTLEKQPIQVDDPIDIDALQQAQKQKKQFIKQKIREQLRNQRKQKKIGEQNFEKKQKSKFKILDVKEKYFKQIQYKEFVKKYFRMPPNPYKKTISEDLKKLFKEVI